MKVKGDRREPNWNPKMYLSDFLWALEVDFLLGIGSGRGTNENWGEISERATHIEVPARHGREVHRQAYASTLNTEQ